MEIDSFRSLVVMKLDWKQPLMKYVAAAKCLGFWPNYTVLSNSIKWQTAKHSHFWSNRQEMKGGLMLYDYMISCYGFLVISIVLYVNKRSSIFPGHEPEPWEHVWSPQDLWHRSYQHGPGREAGPSDRQRWWDQKSYLEKMEKEILFKIVHKTLQSATLHGKCTHVCTCFARLQGPRC